MIKEGSVNRRDLKKVSIQSDMVITGGGFAGVCTAITAARGGIKVTLVQDRPVLGGNASSEVRLWILGATSHMGNNNRWAREGGVVDEILVENMYRNPEGNAIIFDSLLLDKVVSEPNITLLLNTAVYSVDKSGADTISSVLAFCSQNQTTYQLEAPLFCDASGDGIVGFLAGAAFRMGAEYCEEFDEKFAPSKEYGELLGHSLYFYTKDTGKEVNFIAPSFALKDITRIPRYKSFNSKEHGCRLWWIEYGGRLDTVLDSELIKWELWKIVYGVWDHIKNSGNFPEARTMTLEWVGMIPGKRESRRFEGDYILSQKDLVEQRSHFDAVAFGGWSIDLHPADGVYSEKPGCNQWHTKGIYQIPYRTLYSRNISNLFLAGRIISTSHVAFGSSRVMATSAYTGQAVGMAATLCIDKKIRPADVVRDNNIKELQTALQRTGQFIPGLRLYLNDNLVNTAKITASSELLLSELPESPFLMPLDTSAAQLLPLPEGKVPDMVVHAHSITKTRLEVELRISTRPGNFTPDKTLERLVVDIHPGRNCITLPFTSRLEQQGYVFVTFLKNPEVQLVYSLQRLTGLVSVFNQVNEAVSNYGKQIVTEDIGVDEFEFWCPKRRPEGHNIAIRTSKPLRVFSPANVHNGIDRPAAGPNAWVANWTDTDPAITLAWDRQQTIRTIELFFDADYDHPMESVLMTHPETVMPFCVRNYYLEDDKGKVIYARKGNYQTINNIKLDRAIETSRLTLHVEHPSANTPAAVFAIRCYSS